MIRFSKLTILYAACVIAAVFVGPYVTDHIALYVGGPLYYIAVATGMTLFFALYFVAAFRHRIGWGRAALLLAVFLLLLLNSKLIDIPDEKLHLVEYNLLGGLIMRDVLRSRFPGWMQLVFACLFAGAVGWLDESLQGVVPWRSWQVSDYVNNFAGGCSGAVMFFLCSKRK